MDDAAKKKSQEDVKKALKETQQEVMIDLALKTNDFLKKLKAETKKNKVQMQYEIISINQTILKQSPYRFINHL